MSESNQQQSNNSEKLNISDDEWVKQEHGEVLIYCSRNALEVSSIIQEKSAVLPPVVAVWLADSKSSNMKYWVITGDLPNDHIPFGNAKDARDAIRHFVLRWQLKAEGLLSNDDEEQKKFAEVLIVTANGLYDLSENDAIWAQQNL